MTTAYRLLARPRPEPQTPGNEGTAEPEPVVDPAFPPSEEDVADDGAPRIAEEPATQSQQVAAETSQTTATDTSTLSSAPLEQHAISEGFRREHDQPDRNDTNIQTDAKPASTSGTESSSPAPPKLTIKQVVDMAVLLANKKPNLAPAIIHRSAEAARMEVIILDTDTREAPRELARLLQDKLEALAADDYDDASDLLTSFDEDFWAAVNAHAPDEEEEDSDE